MKEWLKHFGISFFSHNTATEAPKHGFASIVLSLFFAFLFFLVGYYCADVVPFSSHYDGASAYKSFMQNAFEGKDISISDGKAITDFRVNTYENDDDGQKYASGGYDLIVDVRPSDTFIEFERYAEKDGVRIGYEEYAALSVEAQKGYALTTVYTDKAADIQQNAQVYAEYLERISNEESDDYNADAAREYAELKASATDNADYGERLYVMYVKYYYNGVKSAYTRAAAPVLRDYYYFNYVSAGKSRYFLLLDDLCAGSFETDGGLPVVFGGYFEKAAGGKVTDIHAFIKDLYYSTAGYTFSSYFVSSITMLPAIVLIPIAIGLIMWGIGKLRSLNGAWDKRFGGCYKIVSAFVWFSAFIAGITTFLLGFAVSARRLYVMQPVIYGAILIVRTVVHCAICAVKRNRELLKAEQNKPSDEIFEGIL